jgi:hypothetical protein
MTVISALELQAIQAAKIHDWQGAITHNLAILDQQPHDIGALIRLGVAYSQIKENKKAEASFKQVIELDKSNNLAKKHLLKIKNHQSISLSKLPSNEEFIEEPGKTKTVELHRLAGKEQLDQLAVGQECDLKPKNRFISVEVQKTYLGSLPEDLSARLSKLIKTGNTYSCYVQSVSPTSCSVFIKEILRSPENEFINSFPSVKSQLATINDMFLADDAVPLQMEDIPLQIVETDADEEEPKSFQIEEPLEEVQEENDREQN